MIRKFSNIAILLLIVILAGGIRLYKLGEIPSGIYLDEAAQGYNAYSILKTGKDEFGKQYPIVFRSFNDFKTPVYTYLIVPLIPLFGLNEFTIRLPSFIFSVLTVLILFLLVKKIARKKHAPFLSIVCCLLLAISPWHILFGRAAFECNIALFLMLVGVYFFYSSLEKPKYLILSSVFLAISVHSYHAQRILTPLLLLILVTKNRKEVFSEESKKYLIPSVIIFLIILLPIFSIFDTPGFLARAAGLNIFSSLRQPPGFIENSEGLLSMIINSRFYLSTREFLSLYLSYFSPRNLFVLGDPDPRTSYPDLATFYVWQAPFYLLGLYTLIAKKTLGVLKFFTIVFLLISPIPAAITRDPYSSIRAFHMVIPQIIIVAIGITEITNYVLYVLEKRMIKKHIVNLGLGCISVVIIFYSLARLYSSAIVMNKHYRAKHWNYGFGEVVQRIKSLDTNNPIVFDNARTESYIELLFFLQTNPNEYQATNSEVSEGDYYTYLERNTTKVIGNITTRPINWEVDSASEKYLIGDSLSISSDQIKDHKLELIEEISYPDGSLAFIIVKTNPKKD